MKPGRMFLAQSRINEVILYCILIDVVLGYILKKFQGAQTVLPLALLYLLNIIVLLAVYRFWKYPVFEWNESGFVLYGISPFRRDAGAWPKVEKAGFKSMEVKKGKLREFLVIVYVSKTGLHKTGLVPMDLVGFQDKVKEELQDFLKRKGINPI